MIRFEWGDARVSLLDAGSLRLDGGAMFGIVPRVLWQRWRPPDERNRISLCMRLMLIEQGGSRTLVDTGAGSMWDEKNLDIYGLERRTADEVLAPAGIAPGDVDRVINSHLHFDHAGGNVERDGEGRLRPAFPNAEYVVQRGELDTARQRNERTRASYLPDTFEPLAESDRLRVVEGDVELEGGVRLEVAPGHTPFMQIVLLREGKRVLAFLADLVPTASHLLWAAIMGYDLEPLRTLETKKRVLPRAVAEDWRVVFEHDPEMPLASLVEEAGRIAARPAEPRS